MRLRSFAVCNIILLLIPSAYSQSKTAVNTATENWHDVEVVLPGRLYAYSYGTGKVVMSRDDGKTWLLQQQADSLYFEQLQFINQKTGWICGEKGIVMYTKNGGKKWHTVRVYKEAEDLFLYGLYFSDKNNGYVSGALLTYNRLQGKLYRTTNGGKD